MVEVVLQDPRPSFIEICCSVQIVEMILNINFSKILNTKMMWNILVLED